MRKLYKHTVLALIGGAVYIGIELLWRGYSHWTMFILGGLLFLLIGGINEFFTWSMALTSQGIIGAVCVTAAELAAGFVVNLWFSWDVWDYTDMPLNLWGQICLPYALLWLPLSIIAVILDDWLRFWLFREEKPRYSVF